ncbi:MAG: hypothetical protein WBD40_00070 [Tepidisphaeraceae bacterium]
MAKSTTKKVKPIKVRKPMDPETKRKLRRIGTHLSAVILLVASCTVGLYYMRRHVEQKLAYPAQPPKVVLKNRPAWMTDLLARQIAKVAQPLASHSSFDKQMLEDTYRVLKANPWIKEIRSVRRAYGKKPGDTLEIDCDYRAPIALVHWGDYYWLVDGEGVKLPEAFSWQQVPRIVVGADKRVNIRIVEGITQAPPEPGRKWTGPDLAAALEMVKTLYGLPYAEEIAKVDVHNFAGRRDPKEAQIVLITKYSSEVRWGQPISAEDFFTEESPATKLAFMKQIHEEYKRVDGNHRWIDIRFGQPTYPSGDGPTAVVGP